ncbi:MAG: colanic acid biosynthesis glycosyltransferase WcaL, partial [Mesorhizobium sp.]
MQHRKIVVVLKGYPRLSETFIAQELLGLERAGFDLILVALRRPTDAKRHPVHDEIKAPVHYLPEYLHEEPLRVVRSLFAYLLRPGFWRALGSLATDIRRDFTRNRARRFGQALVLAAEWPEGAGWLHAHFAHTPASVTRYASQLRGLPWSCSAHAKDIWTSADWDLAGKLSSA